MALNKLKFNSLNVTPTAGKQLDLILALMD